MQIMRAGRVFALACAVIAVSAGATGQSSDAAEQEPAVFSSSSELVVLNATVTDRDGRFVGGLQRDAFTVFEDDRPQSVTFFRELDTPVTAGLLIDSSGSMFRNRGRVVAAVTAFTEASHPDDEFFALGFNERVTSMMPPGMRFTREPSVLRDAVAEGFFLRGRTALYDAVAAGLADVAGGRYERKVLIIISDGGDNASVTTFDEIRARAETSNVVMYAVAIVDPVAREANPKRLRTLARATGGLVFEPSNVEQIADGLAKVSRDIRGGYTLAYVPADSAHDGRQRRLRVRVRTPDGRQYAVRTRAGYTAQVND